MGKTKIQIIDDSAQEVKSQKKKVKKEGSKKAKATEIENVVLEKSSESNVIAIRQLAEKQSESLDNKEIATDSTTLTAGYPRNDETKKAQKPGKRTKIRSKKYLEALAKVDRNKNYSLEEAVNLVKETSYSKYPGSLEIHINTNVKNLRGLVSLPFASGKKLRILAFGPTSLRSAGQTPLGEGVEIGDEAKIEEISKGKINFDVLVTTGEWMPKLARVAKFLGPRGLMPNPKNGTITNDLKKAVSELQSGKTEYKSEKGNPVMHLSVGQINQPESELSQNIKVLLSTLGKSKIKKVTLAPSLGPGVKLDLASI